jgi:hypothetical protein
MTQFKLEWQNLIRRQSDHSACQLWTRPHQPVLPYVKAAGWTARRMSFEHVPKANHVDTSFRPGGMIGMLDYRANKLYHLLALPVKVAARLFEVTVIVICVFITGQ